MPLGLTVLSTPLMSYSSGGEFTGLRWCWGTTSGASIQGGGTGQMPFGGIPEMHSGCRVWRRIAGGRKFSPTILRLRLQRDRYGRSGYGTIDIKLHTFWAGLFEMPQVKTWVIKVLLRNQVCSLPSSLQCPWTSYCYRGFGSGRMSEEINVTEKDIHLWCCFTRFPERERLLPLETSVLSSGRVKKAGRLMEKSKPGIGRVEKAVGYLVWQNSLTPGL